MRKTATTERFDAIADDILETVARHFPVAATSDEFYYFPQVKIDHTRWRQWDRFSDNAVDAAVKALQAGLTKLDQLARDIAGMPPTDTDALVDISLLHKVTRTLVEQLIQVCAWKTQPTWHLTIACIGMAEALESENPDAGHFRAAELAGFLDRAVNALQGVPRLFGHLGLQMIPDTRAYLLLIEKQLPEIKSALDALDRFEDSLRHMRLRDSFLLPRQLAERVVTNHLGCGRHISEIEDLLDREIDEVRKSIESLTGEKFTATGLAAAIANLPHPPIGSGGLLQLYRDVVDSLGRHCLDHRLVSPSLYADCPVRVLPVPAFLSATRTASSYSIPPGSPPTGGVFYVINADRAAESSKGYQREYQILAAHESYPGHHLLDVHRWSLGSRIRRVIEQPVFYEGWACFAEEIMRKTGYFKSTAERLLMARRRLWRAIRGKVDLGLQTGKMLLSEAAQLLAETGIPAEDAMSAARKYPLNPGYQVCYTAGTRRFIDLYDRYGRNDLPGFVRTVMTQGEVDFKDLERELADRTGN